MSWLTPLLNRGQKELVDSGAVRALGRDFKPYSVKTPVTLDVTLKNYRPVGMLSYLHSIQRATPIRSDSSKKT